jgi:pimeloyl-ACP methyl ester carboxylesterase
LKAGRTTVTSKDFAGVPGTDSEGEVWLIGSQPSAAAAGPERVSARPRLRTAHDPGGATPRISGHGRPLPAPPAAAPRPAAGGRVRALRRMTVLAWQRAGPKRVLAPAVVLVHRWASDGLSDWQSTGWVQALTARGLEVLVPDLPGHGDSGDVLVPEGAEPASWTARVMESDLTQLDVGTFSAVGWTQGGWVASHLAVQLPERVRQLVLISCDDRQGLPHAADLALALRDPTASVWNLEAAELLARARSDRRHHLPTLGDWAERSAWPAAPRLGALRTPVLLAVGTRDSHRERAPRLAGLFHDARLVTEPGDERTVMSSRALHADVVSFLRAGTPQTAAERGAGEPL